MSNALYHRIRISAKSASISRLDVRKSDRVACFPNYVVRIGVILVCGVAATATVVYFAATVAFPVTGTNQSTHLVGAVSRLKSPVAERKCSCICTTCCSTQREKVFSVRISDWGHFRSGVLHQRSLDDRCNEGRTLYTTSLTPNRCDARLWWIPYYAWSHNDFYHFLLEVLVPFHAWWLSWSRMSRCRHLNVTVVLDSHRESFSPGLRAIFQAVLPHVDLSYASDVPARAQPTHNLTNEWWAVTHGAGLLQSATITDRPRRKNVRAALHAIRADVASRLITKGGKTTFTARSCESENAVDDHGLILVIRRAFALDKRGGGGATAPDYEPPGTEHSN